MKILVCVRYRSDFLKNVSLLREGSLSALAFSILIELEFQNVGFGEGRKVRKPLEKLLE